MSTRPIVFPPKNWTNQEIVLYHGTIDRFAPAIATKVLVKLGKPNTDFGPGFYTTTSLIQAQNWAAVIAASMGPPEIPAVVEIKVARDALAMLDGLAFVRGDFYADDYWSFVHYCRKGAPDHGRTGTKKHYDIVYGPVAAFWNQRSAIADSDQISFHTQDAEKVLDASVRKKLP